MDIYLVGGAVRDEIMGVRSKDLDYTVVLNEGSSSGEYMGPDPFGYMSQQLKDRGYRVFVESPQFVTVRAQTPDRKETADFVLAREEGPYSDGRRPDWTRPGTLLMDLQRRDFTVNAIAKDEDGNYIDPFNGIADIEDGVIRAVGNPVDRMNEDALRALRALRFSLTKHMRIETALDIVLHTNVDLHDSLHMRISAERKRDELNKMFAYDTMGAISMLHSYPAIMGCLFTGTGLTIEATMKKRK